MTLRHMLDGLMQATGARNHTKLGEMLGLDPATVHRMYRGHRGKLAGLNLSTFDLIQLTSEVSADQLLEWYRIPANEIPARAASRVAQIITK